MRQKSVRNPAGALNVKLLLILSIVGMTLVGGLAGAYFFLVLRSASTIYAKGVELEQAGEFRNARRSYGRVLGKEPRELEYLTALQRVILMTSPNSSVEEFYNAWLGSLKWGAETILICLSVLMFWFVRFMLVMNVRSVSYGDG